MISQAARGKMTRVSRGIGEDTHEQDHGKPFFKVKEQPPPPSPGGKSAGGSGLRGRGGAEDVQEVGGCAGPHSDYESVSDEEEENEVLGRNRLKCKFQGEEVQLRFREGHATERSRAARGVAETEPIIKWLGDASGDGTKSIQDAWRQALPMNFFLFRGGVFGLDQRLFACQRGQFHRVRCQAPCLRFCLERARHTRLSQEVSDRIFRRCALE